MLKPKEIAILFKKTNYLNDEIEFFPIKVIEGIYNEKERCFIDKEGTTYRHIIENPNSYGYCYRDSIENYKKNHKLLTLPLIKLLLLNTIKKYNYMLNTEEETRAPIILFTSKKDTSEKNILLDEEITKMYIEQYPEYYNQYLNPDNIEQEEEKTEEVKEELSIKDVYKNITTKIIDQDEIIEKLILTLWKQNQGIKLSNKNIILDGPSGMGKSKICRLLVEKLNIPSVTISASSGKIKNAEYLILDLVKMAAGDIEKAQKGIIIIDKFEDFIMYSSPEGRGELERLLEDNKFIVSSTAGEFLFNTSNLIIIGITDLNKIKPIKKQILGFNGEEEKSNYKEVLDRYFTTIKLNKLNHNSYIKILNSEEGLLNQNIKILNSKGINISISDQVKDKIALIAENSLYKVKTLECIIEKLLTEAEFEIANNPNLYSELIITPETIDNNKAYKLVRKNGNK